MSGETRKVLIVEDRVTFGNGLIKSIQAVAPTAACQRTDHRKLESLPTSSWEHIDVLLLDGYDLDGQQEDPHRSRLAALGILAQVDRLPATTRRPRIICYSQNMAEPRVNVPLRTFDPIVAGYYRPADLLDHLRSALDDAEPTGQTPAPTADDFRALGVQPGDNVGRAILWLQSDPDFWDQACGLPWPEDRDNKAMRKRVLHNCHQYVTLPERTRWTVLLELAREIARVPFEL